jgi:SAM-dependent methyltransferase
MDSNQLFDGYAADYNATLQRAIGASGESVEFFAELRVSLLLDAVGPVAENVSILDFGCGIGNMTRVLAKRVPKARCVGTDISMQALEVARKLNRRDGTTIEYATTLPERLPFESASFDLALTNGVFHHIVPSERSRWVAELRRVLRPKGRFFIFENNPFNPLMVRAMKKIPFDRDAQLLTPSATAALLGGAGFSTSRPHFYFFFPRFLRSLRPLEYLLRRVPIGAQYFVAGTRV